MTTLRTFIAIELSNEARQVVANLQNRLKRIAPPRTVRWTAPQNIHLTLHFLGNIEGEQVELASTALNEVVRTKPPFSVTLGGLGCFPNLRRPRIVWIGITGEVPLLVNLHERLGEALKAAIDFTPESRPFSPHLTIGRVKRGVPSRNLRQLSAVLEREQAVDELVKMEVTGISLMKSELNPTGAVYSQLSTSKFVSPSDSNQ